MCWSHAATPRCTCTPRRCSPPAICNGERISSASSVSWSADGTAVCARGSWRRWGRWSWCDPPAWWRDWCSPHTNTRPPGCPRVYGPRRDLFCPNTFNEWVKTGLAYTLLIKSLVLVRLAFFLLAHQSCIYWIKVKTVLLWNIVAIKKTVYVIENIYRLSLAYSIGYFNSARMHKKIF